LLPDTRVSTCGESFGFSCASPHANRLRGSSEARVAMRVSISAHHSPCLVRTCSAFLYFGAVNSVSLSARYWNYGGICGGGTVGWEPPLKRLSLAKPSEFDRDWFAFVSGFCIWRKSEPMFGAYTHSASASAIAHGSQSRGRRPRPVSLPVCRRRRTRAQLMPHYVIAPGRARQSWHHQ
jgi:hypothetical protein